jgi:hypothetical protein
MRWGGAVLQLGVRVDRAADRAGAGHHPRRDERRRRPCGAISIGVGFDGVQIGPVDRVDFPQGQLQNIYPDE